MRLPAKSVRRLLIGVASTLLLAGQAAAQTNHIEFKLPGGGDGGTVPIKNGRPINWDASGNLQVTCADDDEDGYCDGSVGKSTGSGEGAASVDYFRFAGGATNLTIGPTDTLNLSVEWQGGATADLCMGSISTAGAGASPTAWPAPTQLNPTGSQAFLLTPSVDHDITYTFTLTCYNESGSDASTGTRTITAVVEQRELPVIQDGCTIVKGVGLGADALFQPIGYTGHSFTWKEAMYKGLASPQDYPTLPSIKPPVGSFQISGNAGSGGTSMRNRYISIAFDEDQHSVKRALTWISAGNAGYKTTSGYYMKTPEEFVYVTISECAGDFRYTTTQKTRAEREAGDPTFTRACRVARKDSNISISNDPNETTSCTLVPGNRYYMNVVFGDPRDGQLDADPGSGTANENTCKLNGTGGKCEIEVTFY